MLKNLLKSKRLTANADREDYYKQWAITESRERNRGYRAYLPDTLSVTRFSCDDRVEYLQELKIEFDILMFFY